MAGNLTIFPDACVLLNFYEGPKFGIVPDTTPVEVDKIGDFYILPELYIGCDGLEIHGFIP